MSSDAVHLMTTRADAALPWGLLRVMTDARRFHDALERSRVRTAAVLDDVYADVFKPHDQSQKGRP